MRLVLMLRRDQGGFTLIETAMAVGLFGIIMVGMSVMFQGAFSTTSEARAGQVAKDLAQEKLEEVRSLPYYEPLQTSNSRDVDILDRYFPSLQTANQSTPTGATGAYVVNGPDGTFTGAVSNSDDFSYRSEFTETRPNVPTLTVRVWVQFVTPQAGGTTLPVQPPSTYDSNVTDRDRPPSDTLKAIVTVTYTQNGRPRSVTLDTLATRIKQQAPKVDASGSFTGLEIGGIAFRDGDVANVSAEVVASFGSASTRFREITDSSSQASARPVEVIERRSADSVNLQPPAPGQSATASVPNSTTGTTQTGNVSVAPGTLASVNAPSSVIASWCNSDGDACQASAQAQVSSNHFLVPEGRASLTGESLLINARDPLQASPNRVIQADQVTGSIDQRSTSSEARVTVTTTVRDIRIWASTSFVSNPRYEGTVIIGEMTLNVEARATSGTADNVVNWQILGLRVWDPNRVNADGTVGGYGTTYNFGFDNKCVLGGGQWTGIPPGQPGHTCGPPSENPNPVVIPAAYQGVVGGAATQSLSVVAGSTIQEKNINATQGISSANTSQKSVITIITREDVTGAAALEPSITTIGSGTATVSYIGHSHGA